MNFMVLESSANVFSTKFGRAIPTYVPRKFSQQKDTYQIRESFLPRKFPTIWHATYVHSDPLPYALQLQWKW